MRKIEAIPEAREYGSFLREQQEALLKTDQLARIGSMNMTAWGAHPALLESLNSDIQRQKPFSLIRLGDGEGNVLFWGFRRIGYPRLARFCMDNIWLMMFGRSGQTDDFCKLHEEMRLAIRGADYLGMAQIASYEQSIAHLCDCPDNALDIRGQAGAATVWDWISGNMEQRTDGGGPVLINAWFHTELTPVALRGLLGAATRLSLITCHSTLLDRFVLTFGVRPGSTYLIPPQYSNANQGHDVAHYPDRFGQIAADLASRDLTGELFLVGAGIVGKIYCNLIKKQGGMAIDAGSMMDVWMGLGVRQYQDPPFIEKHRLPEFAGPPAG